MILTVLFSLLIHPSFVFAVDAPTSISAEVSGSSSPDPVIPVPSGYGRPPFGSSTPVDQTPGATVPATSISDSDAYGLGGTSEGKIVTTDIDGGLIPKIVGTVIGKSPSTDAAVIQQFINDWKLLILFGFAFIFCVTVGLIVFIFYLFRRLFRIQIPLKK